MKPDPHCRIRRVRFKRKSRYRSPVAFDITTSKLLRSRAAASGRRVE